jgi:RimJ/RimL family protein N-acetyltransferase
VFDTLLGPRCRLRLFLEADLETFAGYRSDSSVARFQSWSSYSLDDAKRLYATLGDTSFGTPGTWFQIAVADRQDDTLLGDCALHFLEDGRQVEIGFTLAPQHQGKGLAKEAVALLLDYVFTKLGKHRAIAITDAKNQAAKKLLLGLGFRQEAHYLQNVFFKGGWGDECLFACLASEWRAEP